MIRKVLAAVGVLSVVLGFAVMANPGLAAALSADRAMLAVVALVGVVQALRVAQARHLGEVSTTETPDPETEQDLSVPGENFDELLARARRFGRPEGGLRRRAPATSPTDQVRDRLESAAVATITRKWGCAPDRARRALEEGSWTDDPAAAAFFSDDHARGSVRERFRFALSPEPRFRRRAVRVVDEIAALADADDVDEVPPVDGADSPDSGEVPHE